MAFWKKAEIETLKRSVVVRIWRAGGEEGEGGGRGIRVAQDMFSAVKLFYMIL